jgi:hypothetical protein
MAQANQQGFKLNGTYELLVYMMMWWGESIHTIKKNRHTLLVANKETGPEVNAEQTKFKYISPEQTAQHKNR